MSNQVDIDTEQERVKNKKEMLRTELCLQKMC
jgi:hypothetical protein